MSLGDLQAAVEVVNIFFIVYMAAMQCNQAVLFALGWRETSDYVKRKVMRDYATIGTSELSLPISIIMPAYNEEAVILESVRSLLKSHSRGLEVIVVNDGSSDRTLEVLSTAFGLAEDSRVPRAWLPCEPVRGTYRSLVDERLVVIDKENGGGKADASNAGLRYARYPLFCSTDSDTILEADALPRLVREFQVRPETVAVGGIVRIVNGSTVNDGHVSEVRTPRGLLVNLQIVEYLRAFLLGRTGWSRLRALVIISGAFGVFRREPVVAIGGYDASAIGEDADLVVRLHRHCRDEGIDYRLGFIADPVCWTEAPSTFNVLGRQRERWQRGLLQVLWRYRAMIGRPQYGALGLFALPYFLVFEALGPFVEMLGYLVFGTSFALGWVSTEAAIALFVLAVVLGAAFSLAALLVEERAFKRYRGWSCFWRLTGAAAIENVLYRQWYALIRVRASIGMLLGVDRGWGEMARAGFGPPGAPATQPAAVVAGNVAEPVSAPFAPEA